MEEFTVVVYGAVLVEALVNTLNNVKEKETSWKYWLSVILGLVFGVLVSYNWDIDMFVAMGLPEGNIPYLGAILTGLILSRGSNVISDLLSKVNGRFR